MSCKVDVDAFLQTDWVFENTSAHKIEVVSKDFNSFVIQPGESYTYSESGDGPRNIEPNDIHSPYSIGDKIIIDDREEHILTEGESITDVGNYVALKLEYNFYRFTYTFTEASIQW